MDNRVLSVGNKMEMSVRKNTKNEVSEGSKIYVSQLLDIKEESIVAAMPISEGHIIPLEIGMILETFFYTAQGIFKTDCRVISRGKEDNLFIMELILEGELKKFQRRQFYRLPCSIQAEIRKLDVLEIVDWSKNHRAAEKFNNEDISGMLVDISGGGARLMTSWQLEEGDYIYMKFPIEMNIGVREVELMGKVIMSLKAANRTDCYDNRIQFKELGPELRDVLVKYIFEQQRKTQKRERG